MQHTNKCWNEITQTNKHHYLFILSYVHQYGILARYLPPTNFGNKNNNNNKR